MSSRFMPNKPGDPRARKIRGFVAFQAPPCETHREEAQSVARLKTRLLENQNQASGNRGFANHEKVFRALQMQARPMSAYELLDVVRAEGISAPLTVYRALERLISEGRVRRVESLSAYLVCSDFSAQESTVFMICERCKAVSLLEPPAFVGDIQTIALAQGFAIKATSMEIKGVCRSCAAKA